METCYTKCSSKPVKRKKCQPAAGDKTEHVPNSWLACPSKIKI